MTNDINSLPGNKRDQKPDFSNCKSLDAANSCEVCGEGIQCLCEFVLTPPEGQIWEWKDEVFEGKPIILFQQIDKPAPKLNYHLKGTCIHGKENCCKFYYFNAAEGLTTESLNILGVEGDLPLPFELISEPSEKEDSERLELNNTTTDKNNAYKAYKVTLDDEGNFSGSNNSLEEVTFEDTEATLNNGFFNVLSRSINFALLSEISDMPATMYHIGALESLPPESQNFYDIDISLKQNPPFLHAFMKGAHRVIVLPSYSTIFSLSLDLNGAASTDSSEDAYKSMGFSFNGSLVETINGTKSNKYVTGTDNLSLLVDRLSENNFLKKVFKILSVLNKIEFPSIANKYFKVNLEMPKLTFSGIASLEQASAQQLEVDLPQQKNSYFIKRNKLFFSAAPLVGAKIEIDVLEVLSTMAGPVGKLVKEALDDRSYNLGIATLDVNIYAKFSVEFNVTAKLSLFDSDINATNFELKEGTGEGIFTLEAKIEVGVKVLMFNASFNAGLKVAAGMNFALYQTEKGELGWYIGTVGIAFYWRIEYAFGISGKKDDLEDVGVAKGSVGGTHSPVGLSEEKYLSEEDLLELKSQLEGEGIGSKAWRRKKNDLQNRTPLHGNGLPHYYLDDETRDYQQSVIDKMNQKYADLERINQLLKANEQTAVMSQELQDLTSKYYKNNGLSEWDNQRRLQILRELSKIRKKYNAPRHPGESLDEDLEHKLHEERVKQVERYLAGSHSDADIRDMTTYARTHLDGDMSNVQEKKRQQTELEKEQKELAGDTENFGKMVLVEADILQHSSNLQKNDLNAIKESLRKRLE